MVEPHVARLRDRRRQSLFSPQTGGPERGFRTPGAHRRRRRSAPCVAARPAVGGGPQEVVGDGSPTCGRATSVLIAHEEAGELGAQVYLAHAGHRLAWRPGRPACAARREGARRAVGERAPRRFAVPHPRAGSAVPGPPPPCSCETLLRRWRRSHTLDRTGRAAWATAPDDAGSAPKRHHASARTRRRTNEPDERSHAGIIARARMAPGVRSTRRFGNRGCRRVLRGRRIDDSGPPRPGGFRGRWLTGRAGGWEGGRCSPTGGRRLQHLCRLAVPSEVMAVVVRARARGAVAACRW